jgi:hypothetical protein
MYTEVSNEGQVCRYHELVHHNDNKLMIDITSDSISTQSSAIVKIWSGSAWKLVDRISHSVMKTKHGVGYNAGGGKATDFKADRDELVKRAVLIL